MFTLFSFRQSLSRQAQVDPLSLTPDELGYASAYEAYRVWIHNADIVQPISGDPERQREAMIGLAVAEGV